MAGYEDGLDQYKNINISNLLVRKGYIKAALDWLIANNFLYAGLVIDQVALDKYPEFKYLNASDLKFVTMKRTFDENKMMNEEWDYNEHDHNHQLNQDLGEPREEFIKSKT
jgi:hypothetical protein